ncbi:hypothetical protein [Ferrovibrio sp.]|uniref:hypothetical protein n=1 Tax=Ferrovibrio sp. TaxID=1917215 RepID=UPI003D0BF7AD
MHDAKGRPLKEGDVVLIPAKVTKLYGGTDYCNVSVEAFYGRRPDGLKDTISSINTAAVLRAEDGDENDLGYEALHPAPEVVA